MLRVAVVTGSTRPGRRNEAVAHWVHGVAAARTDAEFELVDIATFALAQLDEPAMATSGKYIHPHTLAWSEKIASFDGYVFVTPEYNHGVSGALKTAIDFLYREWNNKAAGFVSYGGGGGLRSVEHLRLIMAELQVADVRAQVSLSLRTDWESFTTFKPAPHHEKTLQTVFDQVIAWAGALKTVRERAG